MLCRVNAVVKTRNASRIRDYGNSTQQSFRNIAKRWLSNYGSLFEEGDVVLLRNRKSPDQSPILTKPLKHGNQAHGHRGYFLHSDIIGKKARDVVVSNQGHDARLHTPTLAEYVTGTPRLVTPVYPGDANLIVSLLDLHAKPLTTQTQALEILEAGTGHGSLTLHLSRAIHGANGQTPSGDAMTEEYNAWKETRQAILHTVDVSRDHSNHARKMVQGFRRGVYARNIDYHVGDVSEFIHNQFEKREASDSFLSHVLLDLPGAEKHLSTIVKALHVDGSIIVFNPSITQIIKCAMVVKDSALPLWLDQVIELGAGFTAGRPWDVRYVRPRAIKNLEAQPVDPSAERLSSTAEASEEGENYSNSSSIPVAEGSSGWEMICRPKVGERLIGGGFLGMWRKTQPYVAQPN